MKRRAVRVRLSMPRRAAPARLAVLRRLVLWLLVAAVPWQVAMASAMPLAMAAAPAAAAVAAMNASPCHESVDDRGGLPAHGQASGHGGTTCSVCAACCVLAAPPLPAFAFEPAAAPREQATAVVEPAATFFTDGPLRPPRSPRG